MNDRRNRLGVRPQLAHPHGPGFPDTAEPSDSSLRTEPERARCVDLRVNVSVAPKLLSIADVNRTGLEGKTAWICGLGAKLELRFQLSVATVTLTHSQALGVKIREWKAPGWTLSSRADTRCGGAVDVNFVYVRIRGEKVTFRQGLGHTTPLEI